MITDDDSSIRCIQVIAGVLGRAGESGQKKRLEAAKRGETTWLPPVGLGAPKDEEEEKRKAASRVVRVATEEEERSLDSRWEIRDPEDEMKYEL